MNTQLSNPTATARRSRRMNPFTTLSLIVTTVLGGWLPQVADGQEPPPIPPIMITAKPAVVEVRSPSADARSNVKSFSAELDSDIAVDVRALDGWIMELVNRGIIPNPLNAEVEKDLVNQVNALPAEKRAAVLETLRIKRREFQKKVDEYIPKLCLFIEGVAFEDILAQPAPNTWDEYGTGDQAQSFTRYHSLRFRLAKTTANREKWIRLLGGWGVLDRPITVSVGFAKTFGDGYYPIVTEVTPQATVPWQKFSIEVAPDWKIGWSIGVAVLIAVAFFALASYSNLLRDTTIPPRVDGRYPLSLGRCQMAWWFFIITFSFLWLWVITGEYDTITASELTLLGISAATGLGAVFINSVEPSSGSTTSESPQPSVLTVEELEITSNRKLLALAQETGNQIRTKSQGVPAGQSPDPALAAEIESLKLRLRELRQRAGYFTLPWQAREGLLDLLREKDSVNFHRFQLVAWTVILGIIFGFRVFDDLKMPAFGPQLLTLMGLSSGTYLGFKWPAATQPPKP